MYIGARPETRLMYNNSLTDAEIKLSTASVDSFPVENLINMSRTSLYVPKDLYRINDTNRTFSFTIDNGNPITVSIGETGDEGEASAIDLALVLQVIFANGFLVSYNNDTKLFAIRNQSHSFKLLTASNQESWNTIGFINDTYITGAQNTWIYGTKPRRHTDIRLYFDMGGSADCGFFALMGERNKTNVLSPSATVNLKLSNTNDINSATSVNLTPTVNGTFSFLDGIIDQPVFRYLWLIIVDKENVSEFMAFSQLFIGGFVYWDNRTINHGFTLQYLDRSIRTESISGALFFERYNKYPYLSNLKISYLTREQLADLQQAWFDLGKSEHFYLSLDSGHMNNDLSELTFFGVFDSDPVIEEVGPRYFNASFSFRGD